MNNSYNHYNNYKFYNRYSSVSPKTPSGGYRSLPFFKQAEIIQDFTHDFCNLYIDKKSRTYDQMNQGARSGKQCIAEAYLQKSMEGRIKLLGVSRGSYEELLNDYQDFLRQARLKFWEKNSVEAQTVRNLVYKNYNHYRQSLKAPLSAMPSSSAYNRYNLYKPYLSSPESAANAMICLINQNNRLLDQKLRWTEEKFVKEGGFRENLFRKRREFQKRNQE